VLGNLAINDLLFLSVREARLLKIIARSSNDPPLGNRSETGTVLTIRRMADDFFQGGAAPTRPGYPTLLGHCDYLLPCPACTLNSDDARETLTEKVRMNREKWGLITWARLFTELDRNALADNGPDPGAAESPTGHPMARSCDTRVDSKI
jgi:hypothetical protein